MGIHESFEQLNELARKRDELHFSFVKHILLMSSSLFGVLVALHKQSSIDRFIQLSFSLSIAFLSIGIILLSISLFSQVSVHYSLFKQRKEQLQHALKDEMYKSKIVVANPSRIYRIFEISGYTSLILAIIWLSIYAIKLA